MFMVFYNCDSNRDCGCGCDSNRDCDCDSNCDCEYARQIVALSICKNPLFILDSV